ILFMDERSELYQYVGPPHLAEQVSPSEAGPEITSLGSLEEWLRTHGGRRGVRITTTFVVDERGALRLTDRNREHVACSGGRPVLSAGEITFQCAATTWVVIDVSNQSSGFCPSVASWRHVDRALSAIGVTHPDGFTMPVEFRRCAACGQINVIKE